MTVRTDHSGGAGPLLAPWVIAADGLHSPTAPLLGSSATTPPVAGRRTRSAATGCDSTTAYARGDHVEVYWGTQGEAYVTPVADDLVGVAVLSTQRNPLSDSLAQFPGLCERLDGAPVVTSVRGAGPLRQRTTRRVAGRVLLAGDASGYVDALTGEGISLGLAHARAAVVAIVADDPRPTSGRGGRPPGATRS